MSLYRTASATGAIAAPLGDVTLPAATNRITLLVSTDGIANWDLYTGTSVVAANFIARIQAPRPQLYLNNVIIGNLIQGAFTAENVGGVASRITFVQTVVSNIGGS